MAEEGQKNTQQQQQGQKEGEGNKQQQQPTLEQVQEQLKSVQAKLKEVTDESIGRKEKIRTLEKEAEERNEASLKEQNKYKELYEAAQPKVARLEALEPVVQEILTTKTESIPEDKRHLIPKGTPEQQLKWIEDATASGLFYPKGGEKEPPKGSNQKQPPQGGNKADYLTWASDDPRLESLSSSQYQEWKKANGREGNTAGSASAAWGALRK